MTIINGHNLALDEFVVGAHALPENFFVERNAVFEDRYREKYPHGWPQFFADYKSGCVDQSNLDYDEWAFLCEHFLREKTDTSCEPPGVNVSFREKPEVDSGFSFVGCHHCLIRLNTSRSLRDSFPSGQLAGPK